MPHLVVSKNDCQPGGIQACDAVYVGSLARKVLFPSSDRLLRLVCLRFAKEQKRNACGVDMGPTTWDAYSTPYPTIQSGGEIVSKQHPLPNLDGDRRGRHLHQPPTCIFAVWSPALLLAKHVDVVNSRPAESVAVPCHRRLQQRMQVSHQTSACWYR